MEDLLGQWTVETDTYEATLAFTESEGLYTATHRFVWETGNITYSIVTDRVTENSWLDNAAIIYRVQTSV